MKTLETKKNKKLIKRTPEPLYHPVGSVSYSQRIETQKVWKEYMVSLEPTFFITFLFHRRFRGQNIEQITTYGEKKIRMFHKYIHRKLLGKYWYKPEIIDPDEHIKMVLFPQDIKTNLHYHGGVVIKNSKMFPNKIQMFQEHSNHIWNTNKILPRQDGLSYKMYREYITKNKINPTKGQKREIKKLMEWDKDVLVPNGSVDIQTPECKEKVSRYSTRKHNCYENYEHHIIL